MYCASKNKIRRDIGTWRPRWFLVVDQTHPIATLHLKRSLVRIVSLPRTNKIANAPSGNGQLIVFLFASHARYVRRLLDLSESHVGMGKYCPRMVAGWW